MGTLPSKTYKVPTGYGTLYVTIIESNNKPVSVMCTIGRSGMSITAKAEVVGRLVSLALRHDISLDEIVNQLIDISGSEPIPWKDTVIKSIPDAVGKILKTHYMED